jgi:hypothetical protein
MISTHASPETSTGLDPGASARRINALYRGEPADRLPIMPPVPWEPQDDVDARGFGDWRDEEGFRSIARLVQRHCDVRRTFSPVKYPRVWADVSYQRFLEAPAEFIEELPPERLGEVRTRHTTLLHTPGGELKWVFDEDRGVFTRWDMHKPIQCPEDVERMLSVPYRFEPPEAAAFEAFRRSRAAGGADALGGAGVNSMVAMLCGMMSYELLLEWVLAEPGLIRMLADEWLRRTGEKVDFLLSQGVGPFWSFNGVERASPPMMGPRQWDELVVPYDGEIMRRIKAADPRNRIHVHCHGRVRTLLDSFVAMGVDSIDPVEPPPQGDADFAEVKRLYRGRLVFFGNIEFLDMETRTPDEIEELVRLAVQAGGTRNIALQCSAGPHERPGERFYANAERYIQAGLRYGRSD